MKIRIAETKDFSPLVKERVSEIGELDFRELDDDETLADVFSSYDVFWFRLRHKITSELVESPNSKVRFIVTPVTGLNHIDEEACERAGVKIISLKGEREFLKEVRATAEHTLLLTLGLIRRLSQASALVRSKVWDREPFKGTEIYRKKVGIIGFGRLGAIVSEYFYAMGAEVLVYDVDEKRSVPEVYSCVGLDELVSNCNIVSLHINYTPDNVGFFSKELFYKMKSSAVFVNTARGNLVDEEALVEVIKNKKIKGAALDVIADEYELGNSPIFNYYSTSSPDNLLITPHIGGNTFESFEKTEGFVLDRLKMEIAK